MKGDCLLNPSQKLAAFPRDKFRLAFISRKAGLIRIALKVLKMFAKTTKLLIQLTDCSNNRPVTNNLAKLKTLPVRVHCPQRWNEETDKLLFCLVKFTAEAADCESEYSLDWHRTQFSNAISAVKLTD